MLYMVNHWCGFRICHYQKLSGSGYGALWLPFAETSTFWRKLVLYLWFKEAIVPNEPRKNTFTALGILCVLWRSIPLLTFSLMYDSLIFHKQITFGPWRLRTSGKAHWPVSFVVCLHVLQVRPANFKACELAVTPLHDLFAAFGGIQNFHCLWFYLTSLREHLWCVQDEARAHPPPPASGFQILIVKAWWMKSLHEPILILPFTGSLPWFHSEELLC